MLEEQNRRRLRMKTTKNIANKGNKQKLPKNNR